MIHFECPTCDAPIAKCTPTNNAVVHGSIDGACAASERADQLKTRKLVSPLVDPTPSLPS